MRIAVCIEGNPAEDLFAACMEKLCGRILFGTELCFYYDRNVFLTHLSEQTYDLVYLNIKGGIKEACTTLLKLRELDKRVPVFYATEYWRCIEKLYDIGAVAIIRKPCEKRVLRRFFVYEEAESDKTENQTAESEKEKHEITEPVTFFEYAFRRKRYRIRMSEILYFESDGRNIILHLDQDRSDRFVGRLDEIEKRLRQDGQGFVRSHQSYLIRSDVIRRYDADEIRLKNDEILPVSRKKRKRLQTDLQTDISKETTVKNRKKELPQKT